MVDHKEDPGNDKGCHNDVHPVVAAESVKDNASCKCRSHEQDAAQQFPFPGNDQDGDDYVGRDVMHEKAGHLPAESLPRLEAVK